ncbi:MAG TPA: hypothetical protein VN026_04595 [Bacteroidia bacterium]|jgi:hypothetical protein|nr:hypothetical protein [Bacteroidia bacterium]
MAFYYLHELGISEPKNENEFKYLIYSENEIEKGKIFELKHEKNIKFCHHLLNSKPTWSPNDDVIEIVNIKTNIILVKFNKTHDEIGFTVWKNELM